MLATATASPAGRAAPWAVTRESQLGPRSPEARGSQARCSSLPAPALWVEVPSPQGGSVCPPVKTGSEPCGAVQQLDRSVGCRQGEASPTGLHVRGGEHAEMPMSEVWTLQTRGPSHWELVDGNTGQPECRRSSGHGRGRRSPSAQTPRSPQAKWLPGGLAVCVLEQSHVLRCGHEDVQHLRVAVSSLGNRTPCSVPSCCADGGERPQFELSCPRMSGCITSG